MNTAPVIGAGPARHPESGADLMLVTVMFEYAVGGETYPSTNLWCQRSMPEPQFGEEVQWDHRHVWYRKVRYDKPEDDSNPSAPLH